MTGQRVVAVVVTYNRRQMLLDCLDALARQTHPLEETVLVDSASTDGTEGFLEASGIGARLPITYVRLKRNGGGAEGFHYGIRDALGLDSDWLWLMDDDCLPDEDALERLLGAPPAADAATAVLAPVLRDARGALLPIHRGTVRKRFFFAPLVALAAADQAGEAKPIEFCSFAGPLVRTNAARRAGLPLREAFIRFEDVEYLSRFAPGEQMWLVPASGIVHREAEPVNSSAFRAMWGDYARRLPFEHQWKRLYGFRNLIFCGVRHGFIGRAQALSYFAVQAVRTLLFHERRALTLWLLAIYGYDGWRGRFRNVPPDSWAGLAATVRPTRYLNTTALRYDEDASTPGRRLGAPVVVDGT